MKQLAIPELTICHAANIQCKKQLFTLISERVAEADSRLKAKQISELLTQRERLGSTAVSHGCAIPHARIPALTKALCVIVTLPTAINFNDDDDAQMVDIVFCLLVPERATQEHLNYLADIANHIKKPGFCESVRQASSDQALYQAVATDLLH